MNLILSGNIFEMFEKLGFDYFTSLEEGMYYNVRKGVQFNMDSFFFT